MDGSYSAAHKDEQLLLTDSGEPLEESVAFALYDDYMDQQLAMLVRKFTPFQTRRSQMFSAKR